MVPWLRRLSQLTSGLFVSADDVLHPHLERVMRRIHKRSEEVGKRRVRSIEQCLDSASRRAQYGIEGGAPTALGEAHGYCLGHALAHALGELNCWGKSYRPLGGVFSGQISGTQQSLQTYPQPPSPCFGCPRLVDPADDAFRDAFRRL